MSKILVIDDDRDICLLLKTILKKQNHEVSSANDGSEAEQWLKDNEVDLVLCDFRLPDYNGLDMLSKIKIIRPKAQVIIITGYGDVRVAVETLKKGAFDYVTKPLYTDDILHTINNALASDRQSLTSKKNSTSKGKETDSNDFIEGDSSASELVQKHISLIAPTNFSVILTGETGTGKEYVAKRIHQKSKRKSKPFIAIDCGALTEDIAASELFGHVKGAFTGAVDDKVGSFENANGGTLFLDEIGNLSYTNQVKLLRVLQERKVRRVGGQKSIPIDIRIIVATNEDLKTAVEKGSFREDIYHRLNEFSIELQPLRNRPEDIKKFAYHFLHKASRQLDKSLEDIDQNAIEAMLRYDWPGNLRELKNVIRKSVLMCQEQILDIDHLPEEIRNYSIHEGTKIGKAGSDLGPTTPLNEVVAIAEKKAILSTLKYVKNNKSKAARILQIDRKTLYNKLKELEIEA